MKKTLIALLFLSSSAFALSEGVKVSTLTELGLQDDLLTAWDFTTNNVGVAASKVNGSMGGWNSTPITAEMQDGTRYGIIGGTTSGGGWKTGMSGNFPQASFSLSMDVIMMNAETGDVLADIGGGAGTNGDTHVFLATNSAGNIVVNLNGDTVITSTVTPSTLNWTTITLTSGLVNDGDSNQTLSLYVDGTCVGTATGWTQDVKVTAMQFGGKLGASDHRMHEMHLTNLALWKTALTGQQVGSFASPKVPEPATCTLSLLALAGLCARRRKK